MEIKLAMAEALEAATAEGAAAPSAVRGLLTSDSLVLQGLFDG